MTYRWLLLFALSFPMWTWAQCGPCAVGDTCTVDPPFPTVCPAVTPNGTVGVPYALDVTFWIPPSFPEPTTSFNVVLDQVQLISMENVPLGLTYEASHPDLIYYPQVDPFGCVRVCGVPMVAGADTIRLNALVQGTVGGIATTQNYTLSLPIMVYEANEDTTPDFLFSPDSLCAPMTVSFTAATMVPGMTSAYDWDMGNGTTHNGTTPPDQSYPTGGNYPVTLVATHSVPVLTQFVLSNIPDSWCGDIDEPDLPIVGCIGQPDLYFTLADARLALERVPTVSNVQSYTWNNLSFALAFPPFTLRVYDEDGLSDDDLLGSFTFDGAAGTFAMSGASSGQRTVQVQTVLTTSFTDTVVVHPIPNTTLSFSTGTNELCAADQDLSNYVWTLNGVEVGGENGPCVVAGNGSWSVTGTSAFGCSAMASYTVAGVGVEESAQNSFELVLYPIPSDGRLHLRSAGRPFRGALAMRILDQLGRVVHTETRTLNNSSQNLSMELSHLSSGPYHLVITSDDGSATRAFAIAAH